ncbi:MAG: sporulation protein YqfD, partial [Kiritimatiellae bacterium]|nr:sporulation protein YqfD [Kiritimatiellia bacterium]
MTPSRGAFRDVFVRCDAPSFARTTLFAALAILLLVPLANALAGALAALWLRFSGGIVWDIRVEGNSKTPAETIVSQLESLGFGIGTRFRDVDFDQLHADYVAMQNDIAWLSVYMDGTVARVQVRELWADGVRPDRSSTGANVVAGESGVIEEVNVFEGEAAVKPGAFVLPGQ